MPKLSWNWLTFGIDWRELLAVWGVIIAIVLALHGCQRVYGQEAGNYDPTQHEMHHDVYKNWKQPNSEFSCCNANEYADDDKMIHLRGDCEATDAELRGGHWFARLPKYLGGSWIEVPDGKVIKEINPDPNRAHLCYSELSGGVLCFVPPFGGM